ncbi:hypothetical protein WJ968_28765 [Achromobacter xylosoxidans]
MMEWMRSSVFDNSNMDTLNRQCIQVKWFVIIFVPIVTTLEKAERRHERNHRRQGRPGESAMGVDRVPLDADWLAAMAAHYHVIPWAQADAAARVARAPW